MFLINTLNDAALSALGATGKATEKSGDVLHILRH